MTRKRQAEPSTLKPIVRNTRVVIFSDRRGPDNVPVIEDPIASVNYNPEQELEISIGDDELWIQQKGSEFVINVEGTSYVK